MPPVHAAPEPAVRSGALTGGAPPGDPRRGGAARQRRLCATTATVLIFAASLAATAIPPDSWLAAPFAMLEPSAVPAGGPLWRVGGRALDLELVVRMHTGAASTLEGVLLPSLAVFWPPERFGRLRLVWDDVESDGNASARVDAAYPALVSSSFVGDRRALGGGPLAGYHIQQYDTFWFDRWSNATFIGVADADALLVTLPTELDFFDEAGRPRVIGRVEAPWGDLWMGAAAAAAFIVGKPQPFRCMAYFPVILHRSHFGAFRAHIETLHNASTATVYARMAALPQVKSHLYSQFNILCTYLWHYQHDEYAWSMWLPSWTTRTGLPDAAWYNSTTERSRAVFGAITDYSFVTVNNSMPIARPFIHWRHASPKERIDRHLVRGFCWALNGAHAFCRNEEFGTAVSMFCPHITPTASQSDSVSATAESTSTGTPSNRAAASGRRRLRDDAAFDADPSPADNSAPAADGDALAVASAAVDGGSSVSGGRLLLDAGPGRPRARQPVAATLPAVANAAAGPAVRRPHGAPTSSRAARHAATDAVPPLSSVTASPSASTSASPSASASHSQSPSGSRSQSPSSSSSTTASGSVSPSSSASQSGSPSSSRQTPEPSQSFGGCNVRPYHDDIFLFEMIGYSDGRVLQAHDTHYDRVKADIVAGLWPIADVASGLERIQREAILHPVDCDVMC